MKKMNKKGFTIVELVIVIAVIAILAGVMIPTFSGVVNTAKQNKALQLARNAYSTYVASLPAESISSVPANIKVVVDGTTVYIANGACSLQAADGVSYTTATYSSGTITIP